MPSPVAGHAEAERWAKWVIAAVSAIVGLIWLIGRC